MTRSSGPIARIEVSQEPGTLILRLFGELDAASRDTIEPAVMAAIPTAYTVVLDLGALTFCDSSGLSMFVAAQQKADAESHALVVRNPPPMLARLFALSGVDQLLSITG